MDEEGGLLAVVDLLYAAAVDPSGWPAALVALADLVGAEDAALGSASPHGIPWLIAPRTDPSFMATYGEYHAGDVVWERIVGLGEGRPATDQMVLRHRELDDSAYQNEWCKPQGYHHKLGALVLAEQGWRTVLVMPGRRPFDRPALDALARVLPHLKRAVQLGIALEAPRGIDAATHALLDRVAGGAFLSTADGKVVSANAGAEGWFRSGLRLLPGRRLGPGAGGALARRIAASTRWKLRVPPDDVELLPGLFVRVHPLRDAAAPVGPETPVALVLEAPRDADADARLLCERFGLTDAEARLALEMRAGDGRRCAAQRRGIRESTARTHLSRVFDKLQVRRQAELVARLDALLR